MPRNLPAGVAAASQAETVRPIYLAELDFASGFVRATTAPFTVDFDPGDGEVPFLGVGDLGGVSAIEESTEGRAHKITLTLSGIKRSLVSTALAESYQGRPGKLWKAYLDAADQIIGAPALVFQGLMDVMPIKLGETATISVVIVSRFARWERPVNNPRWDDVDHQARRPGDKFFEFLPEVVAGKEIIWGVA